MTNNIKLHFLRSLFIIPFITGSFMANPMAIATPGVFFDSDHFIYSFDTKSEIASIVDNRAEKIDAYFSQHDLPLEGFGEKMVAEADLYGLDWRLLPALAMRESTGGKFTCKSESGKNNPFGWGSCKIGFDSYDHSIEVLARNLSGNNPKTSHYYDGKDIRGILETYNPPSVVPKYADQVMKIMSDIENINA